MAIRPKSFPRYAFVTSSASENDPNTRPHPLLHSNMNDAEHKFGNNSLMYNPSVMATSVPLEIQPLSHATPPNTDRCPQSHVFPHDCNTSKNDDKARVGLVLGAVESRRQCSPSCVDCTNHIL